MNKAMVQQALTDRPITAYLESRGIHPVKKVKNRYLYRCPLHAGDNDPSFVVYEAGTGKKPKPYQSYHCFGCHSGSTLINLMSEIESKNNTPLSRVSELRQAA